MPPAEPFAVSASADGTLMVWRLRDGRRLATLRGHTRAVTAFQLSGTRLVSASMDRTVRAWELSGVLARAIEAPPAGDGAEDGEADGAGDDAADSDASPPQQQSQPQPPDADDASEECLLYTICEHDDFVRCVCFDHHKVISCADDGHVCLFSFNI